MKECIDTKTGWINCKYFHFNYKQIHHAYYGIILVIIGVILITRGAIKTGWYFIASGIIIFLDDLVQHVLQGYKLKGDSYISPLAQLVVWSGIYNTELWEKLTEKYKFLKN